MRAVQQQHPRARTAIMADLRYALRQRGDTPPSDSRRDQVLAFLHLVWHSDAFAALVCYRVKAACQRRGIPVVPALAHRAAMVLAQVCIGDPVLVHPGVLIPHGQVVIDGFVEIHRGARLRPFIVIGLAEGDIRGPVIEPEVSVGTGAKVLGPITVGTGARIGAGAIVLSDVAAGATVVGIPARPV
ncbi:MAG: hypothetical protein R2695_00935 [Acidimicrobiales bacterium]